MMRKLLISQMITLDGFFARKNGDIDWHMVEEDFNQWAVEQLNEVDTLIFGRKTYEMMASYWPTPAAAADDTEVALKMNELHKVVFSNTLADVTWENSTLVKGDIATEIAALKVLPGKSMVIFGSGEVTTALANLGLIDEYRLLTCPIVLGEGMPLFNGLTAQLNLKLTNTRTLINGVILSTYVPA